jgi:DNA repair exonuclease SbcCD nuclease subunit
MVVLVTSFQQSLPFHRRQQYRRRRTVSLLWAQKFQLGEEVMVMDDDGTSCFTGMIEQKKGGWYTIRNVRDSTKWVKRRASQLQTRSPMLDTEEGTQPRYSSQMADSTNPTLSSSSSAARASANLIIDLDSIILQSSSINNQQRYLNDTIDDKNHTIISLETIHQVTNCHSQYNRWLLFSDLHVMPSTLSTCITVLDTVHKIAIKYNSGIIFLGDFWHHRGFVQVNCLNAILAAMANWKVPIIMIPGNHDQVDYRGLEHALTPLCNAYRIHSPNTNNDSLDHNTDSTTFTTKQQQQYNGPLILSHPTKFMNALFIPHIRDKELMKSILSSTEAITSSALFVHADVKGASMNDLITSRHGLSESIFPTNKYIYSGHFHKPHEIQIGKKKKSLKSSFSSTSSSSIRYVGSPYQTSFSESGQVKSLLLVDSNNGWQCIDEIPIDVGPRYHRISSLHHFLDCSNIDQAEFRTGDKVIVTIDPQELEEMHITTNREESMAGNKRSLFNVKLNEFRQSGISVEIRDIQSQQPEDVDVLSSSSSSLNEDKIEFEDQSPMTTFITYLSSEVNRSELGEATAKKLTSYGEDLLREANDGSTRRGGGLVTPGITTGVCELEIESVSVLGFGSFCQEVLYPLSNRGVVLLKGVNNDDIGSDSNGVGKSTLAMSALWSLSGSLDARPTQDGKVADVVNDSSMNAEVTLRGFINSKPFLLKRTKSTSAKDSSLIFNLDGENLTQQSIQGTQQLIDQHLNIGTLMRTVFHGQHSIGG